ncbi:MAG: HAMP domain-containing histidine kinase [Candidatus Yonathbacteria bacterium]|nr:HAMP domain-containing histidine kinase [Candidatus Yonathbacteria bacterium]
MPDTIQIKPPKITGAVKPISFLPRVFSKDGLISFGIIIGLAVIMWVLQMLSELIVHQMNRSALIIPAIASILLFIAGSFFWKQAKKTDVSKYEFVTVAAHRLRTPLSRLGWMIAGLRDEVKTESGKSLVEDATKTSAELTSIANQLLTAAEAGESSLYYSYIPHEEDLGLIVRQVIGEYAIGAMKKNIEVLISAPTDLPKVYVDRDRICEALGSFLENAILYTPQQGRIEVVVVKERNHLKVSVKDNGIGISKNELPYVFTKFFRTKGAVASDADRAGLGLAISKDIIERHSGEVGVESEGNNQGSRFWFTLPIASKA